MTHDEPTPGETDFMPTHAERIVDYITTVAHSEGVTLNGWATQHGITPSNISNWSSGKTKHIEMESAVKLGRALGISALAVLRIAGYELVLGEGEEPPALPVLPVSIDDAIATGPDPDLEPEDREQIRNLVKTLRLIRRGGRPNRTSRRKP
jgi:hypothetical protein